MESSKRSLYKSLTWRPFPTLTLILVAYILSKDIKASLLAGLIELPLKFALYFIHERMWASYLKNREQSKKISVIKSVVWRLFSVAFTFTVAFVALTFFGKEGESNGDTSVAIAVLDHSLRLILYYLHERAWLKWAPLDKAESISEN